MPPDLTPLSSTARRALESTLGSRVAGQVDFSVGARALSATDASNYRQTPIGVVLPRTIEDVIETVRTCYEHHVAILPRGAGTSLAGQCCNSAVTREEQHSTRGRARLLFEMLRGDTITTGWDSVEVKQALDLCLACKACKSECPVSVDMASYKAEFLAHHYERRSRPLRAHLFGHIDW